MSDIVINQIISKLPSKCPIPDYSGRSSLSPTLEPQTNRSMSFQTNPSHNILLDEISKLRKQNKQLKHEMRELRQALNQNNKIHKSGRKPIFQKEDYYQYSPKDKDIHKQESIVQQLKKDKQKLIIVVNQSNDKISKLEKETKTLKQIIAMNIELSQDKFKSINNKLEQKNRQLMNENKVLREHLNVLERNNQQHLTIKPQKIDLNLNKYQRIIQELFNNMNNKEANIMKQFDKYNKQIRRLQSAINLTKAKVNSASIQMYCKKDRNIIQDSLQVIQKQMTNTNNPSVMTKSIVFKSAQVQTDMDQFIEQQSQLNNIQILNQIQQSKQQLNKVINLCKQYKLQSQQKDKTISNLKNAASTLDAQIKIVQHELRNTKQNPLFSESKQMLDLRRQIQELKRIIELSKKPMSSTIEQIKLRDSKINELKQELIHSKQIIKQLESQLENVDNNENGIGLDMIEEVNQVKQQFNKFIEQNKELKSQLEENKSIINRLQSFNRQLVEENQIVVKEIDNFKANLQTCQKQKEMLQIRNNDNEQIIRQLKDGLNKLQHLSKQLQEKNKQLQALLQIKQRVSQQTQNRNREIKMYNQQLKTQSNMKDNLLFDVFDEINRVKQILIQIDFKAIELNIRKYSSLGKQQLEKRLNKIHSLQIQLKNMHIYKQNSIKLSNRVTEIEHQKQRMFNNLKKQKISNAKLISEIDQLRTELNSYVNTQIQQRSLKASAIFSQFQYREDNNNNLSDIREKIHDIQEGVRKAEKYVATAIKKKA